MDLQTQRLMMAAAGAVGGATYVDDVFSTFLYKGTGSAITINNGIDLAGSGGMVWTKARSGGAENHGIGDTENGVDKIVMTNSSAQMYDNAQSYTAFNNNGYTFGTEWIGNRSSSYTYSSWTFRKAPGFFDVVTYTGTGSVINLSHSLGCVPGCVMIKKTSGSDNWSVYHRGVDSENPEYWWLGLNITNSRLATSGTTWNNTKPTSTHVTIGTGDQNVNTNGETYVAYIFAGAESTAATARSVDFSGNNYLNCADSSLATGTGLFTYEFWIKLKSIASTHYILDTRTSTSTADGFAIYIDSGLNPKGYNNAQGSFFTSGTEKVAVGGWSHIAIVRDATNSMKLYVNGTQSGGTFAGAQNWTNGRLGMGVEGPITAQTRGYMSNVRLTVGQALYTSSFKPPTEPLTTTSQGAIASNVKVLCCNNSSVTGGTAGTITPSAYATGGGTASGPAASSDSPFDDPAGFVFGDAGDQNVIKCGSYVGSGSAGLEINLGWEPSFIIVKSASAAENWEMYDSMRGIATGGDAERLKPNTSSAEDTNTNWFALTANGFIVNSTSGTANTPGDTYIFLAIRRPDGYVGKPPELGTDVFAMDGSGDGGDIPAFISNFPVDFALNRDPGATHVWQTAARLLGTRYVRTNGTNAESTNGSIVWDSNSGYGSSASMGSSDQAWMWKRHAGFDCLCYTATGNSGLQIRHSLSKIPEMIWTKRRNSASHWRVYHKGLNGGTNPEQYVLNLNENVAEADRDDIWNDTAPTSTNFTLGNHNSVNNAAGDTYMAMLFASVDGISKVGSYTGQGSNGHTTVTTGFTPRFLIVKARDASEGWWVLDTTRGWGAGDDKYLMLNTDAAQVTTVNVGEPLSTGFKVTNQFNMNVLNREYIYYAHA